MALFYAAIRRDSVCLLMFPALSHIQVFLSEMFFISRLKLSELFFFPSLFPSYYHSLVHRVISIVFMAVINPLSCFSMQSSSRCIDASKLSSMLASSIPPSFLDTYSLSTLSHGCNTLCMVISFLVLWSI